MLDCKQKLAVIVVCIIFPATAFFLHQGFIEYDSYASLTYLKNGDDYAYKETNFTQKEWAGFLENLENNLNSKDNYLELKFLWILWFLVTCVSLYFLGEIFRKGSGFLILAFTQITPLLITNSFKFENEAIGFGLLIVGLIFFLSASKAKSKSSYFAEMIVSILFFAWGLLFWGGGIYLLFALSLSGFLFFGFIFSLALFFFPSQTINSIIPNFLVTENSPVIGLLIFTIYASFLWAFKTPKMPQIPYPLTTIFLVVLGTLNPKFFILAVPFIALYLSEIYHATRYKKAMLAVALTLSVCFSIPLLPFEEITYSPKPSEFKAAQEIVKLSQETGKEIKNDWTFGHLIRYYGGKTNMHSGGNWEVNSDKNTVVLTRKNLNCILVKNYSINPIYPLKLYSC